MEKKQIIILVIVIVLVFGGIIGWTIFQKGKLPPPGETTPTEGITEETFSLTATVVGVDAEHNFLTVKPKDSEKQIKVLVSDTTKLIKIEFPFDPKNPPKEATFTPKQTETTISGFSIGDSVYIKAKENIAGKTEFDNVDFIHILP